MIFCLFDRWKINDAGCEDSVEVNQMKKHRKERRLFYPIMQYSEKAKIDAKFFLPCEYFQSKFFCCVRHFQSKILTLRLLPQMLPQFCQL